MPRNKKEDSSTHLPDATEEIGISIWDGVPFYFDPKSMQFLIGSGDKEKRLDPLAFEDQSSVIRLLADHIGPVDKDSDKFLYMIISRSLVQLPSFRRELALLTADPSRFTETMSQVETIMRKVYKKINPSAELPRLLRPGRPRGPMVFSSQANTNGMFRVQTFGNCACLERDPGAYGVFVPQLYPPSTDLTIPLVYNTHNADFKAERVSLYAGAGALAYLVKNRPQTSI